MTNSSTLLKKCHDIVSNINSKNLETYRDQIFATINSLGTIKIVRDFTCTAIGTDLHIQTDQQQKFSLADFFQTTYNITPSFQDAQEFWYANEIINYPQTCIDNFWFWLDIGHEWAHHKNQPQEEEIKKHMEHKSAIMHNDKKARTDSYKIIKKLEQIYGIHPIREFKSIEDICAYANIHLLAYIHPSSNIEQVKQTMLQPKHFIQEIS